MSHGRGLPYAFREGLELHSSSFNVVEGQWTTKGAQEFPFGVVVVDEAVVAELPDSSSPINVGGPVDNQFTLLLSGS